MNKQTTIRNKFEYGFKRRVSFLEYPLILVNLLINQSNEFAVRQLAGVLAKQFIEVHWSQNSDKFQEPEIDQFAKLKIRHLLPLALNDQSSKIRTTVAFVIASIAHWDWPELWPELFGILLTALSGNLSGTHVIDLNGVHGALETLTEIVHEVTDIQMPQVAPAVLPQLYKIFIDPVNFSLDLRNKAVSIFTSLANVVAEMAEYDTVCLENIISISTNHLL